MMATLFIVVIFFLCGEATTTPFVLNRVSVTKNIAKQLSVRFHGYSPELVLVHTILRFSSPINYRHNALLIEQSSLSKYKKILQEEDMKMTITSRSIKKILSYHTVTDNTTSDANGDGIADKLAELVRSASLFGVGLTATVSYDGLLLLDEFSAIWSDYNVMIFSHSLLTFLYREDGALAIPHAKKQSDFNSFTHFACDPAFDSDQCLVLSPHEGLEINGQLYPTYRVIVDLDSSENLLPIDLFLRWRATETRPVTPLSIKLGEGSLLHLNRQFSYTMHQSNVIVVGVDLIHNFPHIEYSVVKKEFLLSFNQEITVNTDTQYTIEILFLFLNLGLLFCLFLFGTSYNYNILNYMIAFGNFAKTAHFFAHKQILIEGLTIIISFVVVIVSLAVDDPDPTFTAYESRKTLFIVFLLYHIIITLFIVIAYTEPNRCALQHYFTRLYNLLYRRQTKQALLITPLVSDAHVELEKDTHSINAILPQARQRKLQPLGLKAQEPVVAVIEPLPYSEAFVDIADRGLAKRLHKAVVGAYHDPVIQLYTPVSIVRNLAFITTLLVAMALLFNFYTPQNNIYLLLIVALSFAVIYFQVKYMAVSVVYLSLFYPCPMTRSERAANTWFIVFLVVEAIATALYIVFAYESVYVTYFDTVNSTHSPATINAYILSVIATLVLLAVMCVTTAFDKYADPLIEKAVEECERIRKLRLVQ